MKPKKMVYARTVNMIEDADPVKISLVNRGANQKRFTLKSERKTGTEIKKIAFADVDTGMAFVEKNFDDADIYDESAWSVENEQYIIYSKDFNVEEKLAEIKGENFTIWVNDPREAQTAMKSDVVAEKTCSTLLADQIIDQDEINMSKTIDKLIKTLESALTNLKKDEDEVEEVKEEIKEEVKEEIKVDEVATPSAESKLEEAEKALETIKTENAELAKEIAKAKEALEAYEGKFAELLAKTEKFETQAKESQVKYETLIKSVEDSKLKSNSSEIEAIKADTKEEVKANVKKSAFLSICEQLK
jgi:predicted  nucleic acid-binding Zn-ribbon protein